MKVWVTRHCLTDGVYAATVDPPDKRGFVTVKSASTGFRAQYLKLYLEAFVDKEDAIARAEEMRQFRIRALKSQIDRLEGLDFVRTIRDEEVRDSADQASAES